MATEVWDPQGRLLPAGVPGELVCTQAFPSLPIGFHNDPDGSQYRATYFDRFSGIWHHGDWAERTDHGGFVIHGRSDATLNPSGVRIGTAELYRPVEQIAEVVEALAIGFETGGGQEIALFLVLQPGLILTDELRTQVRRVIRSAASPRHVPARIEQVPALPRTMSGKVSEIAVRDTIMDEPVRNLSALANPEVLDDFRRIFTGS